MFNWIIGMIIIAFQIIHRRSSSLKTILFFGAYDKTDTILNFCKVLNETINLNTNENKVLIVDATEKQLYQFAIPRAEVNHPLYEFDRLHFVNGFTDFGELAIFLDKEELTEQYDYLVIDTDQSVFLKSLDKSVKSIMVTDYKRFTIMQNKKLVDSLCRNQKCTETTPLQVVKIIHHLDGTNINEEYIEHHMSGLPIKWAESFYIDFDEVNLSMMINNQYTNQIDIKSLSKKYKKMLMDIVLLTTKIELKQIKKGMKRAMRRDKGWR